MKPPADLHPLLVALGDAYARRAGIAPGDFWAYVTRRQAPPDGLRDAIVAAFFPRVPPDSFLPSSANGDTFDTSMQAENEEVRRGRPMSRKRHPFVAALLREGLTTAEIAKELKRPASTVRAWYKDTGDVAYRPIPRGVAEQVKKRLGVPLSAWPRIAD